MFRNRAFVLIVFACLIPLVAFSQAQEETGAQALLELNQSFFYEESPFPIRVSVRNASEKSIKNPIEGGLLDGFLIKDGTGKAISPASETSLVEPQRPEKLAGGAFYGWVLDLSEAYPQLKEVGTYSIEWMKNGISAQTITVRVLPKFDPSKTYEATLKTSEGDIVIRLLGKEAPITVKAFVDMVQADFYDGLAIHEVRADRFFTFGDPQTASTPRVPFLYPVERSKTPLVAGTVVMKPARPAPPANGSQFMVLLQPEPAWEGQVTAFGQVIRGMDIARKISNLPNNGRNTRPFFKPIEDLRVSAVEVSTVNDESAAENTKNTGE